MLKIRAERQQATRRKILDAAGVQFRSQGYESATMRDIAAAAGLSTGSIFANFTGKAQLFEAAIGVPVPDMPHFLRAVAKGELVGIEAAREAARLHKMLTGRELVAA